MQISYLQSSGKIVNARLAVEKGLFEREHPQSPAFQELVFAEPISLRVRKL